MIRSLSRIALAALFASFALSGPVQGQPNKKKQDQPPAVKREESPEAIRKILDRTVDVESGTSLAEALMKLGEANRINIVLDRVATQQMGFDPSEMPNEYEAKGVKLRSALKVMCGHWQLAFAVVGDSVIVSTEEMIVYRQLKQKIAIEVSEQPFSKVVLELGKKHGVNILIDPRFKGKMAEVPVTLSLDEVPLEAAVRLLAEMAGMKPARIGNVLLMTSEERADKLKDSDSLVPSPNVPMGIGGFVPVGPGVGGANGGNGGLPVPKLDPLLEKTEDRLMPPEKVEEKKQ